jgi:hypothetical protein
MRPVLFNVASLLALGIASALQACDAHRSNPLDPLSENGGSIAVVGQVTSFYAPFRPLGGVNVVLNPGQLVVATDSEGRFSFRSVVPGDYIVSVLTDGFDAPAQSISVTPGLPQDVTVRLDALPRVVDANVYSVHISRWWPEEDLYLLTVDASTDDDDGIADLDSAWVTVGADYAFPLTASQDPGRFMATKDQSELPVRVLDDILGQAIRINVADKAGFNSGRSDFPLVRIIHETPIALSPIDLQIVTGAPTFVWTPPLVPFNHTMEVQVVRVELNVETIVETISNIPSTSSTVVGPSLPAGTYYWVVWIVDQFGNRSRSKQAGYRVP